MVATRWRCCLGRKTVPSEVSVVRSVLEFARPQGEGVAGRASLSRVWHTGESLEWELRAEGPRSGRGLTARAAGAPIREAEGDVESGREVCWMLQCWDRGHIRETEGAERTRFDGEEITIESGSGALPNHTVSQRCRSGARRLVSWPESMLWGLEGTVADECAGSP